jgi:hypothetical protein
MMNTTKVALASAAVLVAAAAVAGGSAQGSAPSRGGDAGWPVSASRAPAQALSAARAEAARDGNKTFTVVEVEERTASVDVGDAGEGPGDYFLFESRLMSQDGSKQVGRDSGRCMIAVRTFTCDATASIFGKGKIVVSGTLFGEADSRIAITGGTGAFKDAAGQLTVIDTPDGKTLLTFELVD